MSPSTLRTLPLVLPLAVFSVASAQTTFNCTNGSQTFTASTTGIYHIVVNGAQGGNTTVPMASRPSGSRVQGAAPRIPLQTFQGGLGASVTGDFFLSSGQVLTIYVGCLGVGSDLVPGSGGGGTFVVAAGATPVLIAGGGGGAGFFSNGDDGQASTNGTNGGGMLGGAGGTSGNGGQGGQGVDANGGGGTGFLSAGTMGSGPNSGGGGQTYPIFTGGTSGFGGDPGGYGGGGGSSEGGAGGGGGYSGGGGSDSGDNYGGGGGSFISAAVMNSSSIPGANMGNGSVVITPPVVPIAPTIAKAFGASTISTGQTTTLSFTVTNPNGIPLTGVTFTDPLPPGLSVATPPSINGMCGGTVTAPAGGSTINLTGGMLAANGSCTIVVNVTGTAVGSLVNTTTAVTSAQTGPGNMAVATINVVPVTLDGSFQVKIFPNLGAGDAVINIGNTGASGTVPVAGGFNIGGTLCVNVYVFSPDEQEVACCTCQVTPNGVATTSARQLISKTLTPAVPTAVTVKLLSTTATTCNPASPLAPAIGLIAFGTNLHAATVGGSNGAGTFATTETPFIPASLSAAELSRITTLCGFIQSNGTGFGVCPGCQAGAAGAAKH